MRACFNALPEGEGCDRARLADWVVEDGSLRFLEAAEVSSEGVGDIFA